MMDKSRFQLACAIGARGIESFHTPGVGKFSILVKPDHSRRDDARVVGNGIASADSVAFACVLVTSGRKACAVPNTAVITSKRGGASGSMRVGMLPPSRAGNIKNKGGDNKEASSHDRITKDGVAGRSLFVATATDGAAICRRRTVLLACGICALMGLERLCKGVPSLGGFRARRMRLPRRGAFSLRRCGKEGCGAAI